MNQWEYLVIREIEYPNREKLNKLGFEGWNLVSFVLDKDYCISIFKRKIEDNGFC